jgi:hypothetical protein
MKRKYNHRRPLILPKYWITENAIPKVKLPIVMKWWRKHCWR